MQRLLVNKLMKYLKQLISSKFSEHWRMPWRRKGKEIHEPSNMNNDVSDLTARYKWLILRVVISCSLLESVECVARKELDLPGFYLFSVCLFFKNESSALFILFFPFLLKKMMKGNDFSFLINFDFALLTLLIGVSQFYHRSISLISLPGKL